MEDTCDFAYKFGAGRYIQEQGALRHAGKETARLGTKAYVLSGETAYALAGTTVEAALAEAGVPFVTSVYGGACSQEHAEHVAGEMARDACDVIIGVGGGRILDLAKLVARIAGVPVITVPTSSATCAAFTPLSVVYTPEGKTRGTWYFPNEVSAVLIDMDIIGHQPARLLAAGIVDALAKWVEVRHHFQERQGENAEDFATAALLAEQAYRRLMEQADDAYRDTRQGLVSRAIWNAVYLSIALAGMVSGTARGQYQSALAHAIYEWVRIEYPQTSRPWLHGEIVGVGLFPQMAYAGDDRMAQALQALMRRMDMPTRFDEVGLDMDVRQQEALYAFLCATRFVPRDVEAHERVRKALARSCIEA